MVKMVSFMYICHIFKKKNETRMLLIDRKGWKEQVVRYGLCHL